MADEQYRWLDRETAERLLSGESLEAVDVTGRDRAERLAKTLDALSVETAPTSAELPGEAAALAAFRTVRAARAESPSDAESLSAGPAGQRAGGRTGGRAGLGERARSGAPATPDIGVVRIGGPGRDGPRPRRGRAIRLGLAAALAVGMVGSAAAAAVGTGVLPGLFGEADPDPGASASAQATPNRPLVSPSPGVSQSEPSPGDATGSGQGSSRDTTREGSTPGPGAGAGSDGRASRPGDTSRGSLSACRDMRDGKGLTGDRRHALEGAAGGASHVKKYCKAVLADSASADHDVKNGKKDREERTKKAGEGDKDDDGHGDGRGHRGRSAGGTGSRGGEHGEHGDRGTDGPHRGSGGNRHDPDGGTRTV
ncbi:hypothetical protein SALBM311S_00435 [Streptomyces alboniger]